MKRGTASWGAGFGSGRRSSQPASSGSLGSTSSDRADMASGPSDVLAGREPAEVREECSGKKKSKFQTFKKFFARKKRKEPTGAGADAGLKASQSSDNVSKASENNALTRSEKDKAPGSKVSLGSKALSHDSVFVSDSSEANEALGASQDSIHGKVKSLQLQLKQAIKMGSPPALICVKGREDAGATSEDDGLPCSPPEYTNLHTVTAQAQGNSSISLDRDDDQLSCAASSGAVSPLVVPGDFSQPASPFGCLDNSAARHKMGLRHKACNKRKPASRLEMKAEGDSADEALNTSTTEASVEHEQPKTEDVSFDELQFKVEGEEKDEEEEEEEAVEEGPPQRSTLSPSKDKEEGEEGEEEESEAEQDVSHGPDAVASPEPSLSEEDVSDALPLPSSRPCSTASSVDSPRVTPEPPAGPREYLLDPPGVACGTEENRDGTDLEFREDEEDRGAGEEVGEEEGESSLLQEVLSSLKTPLASCSLSLEAEVLEMEQDAKGEDREEFEIEEGEEMKEEEAELEGTDSCRSVPSGFELLGHGTEEEEDAATVSCQEEAHPEEELDEEEAEEEEDVLVDQFSQHGEGEEVEEVQSEQENYEFVRQTHVQEEEGADEDYGSEGEEEAIELEKEPEAEEEGREKTEEPVEEEAGRREGKERVEEAEEAIEEERDDAEEMTERFPDADDDARVAVPLQSTAMGPDAVAGGDAVRTTKLTDDEETPAEAGEEGVTVEPDCKAAYDQTAGDESDDGEEKDEEAGEPERTEPKSGPEEDVEANQEVAGQDSEAVSQKEKEDGRTEAEEQASVPSKPPSLSLLESSIDSDSQESKPITPSKTSTTTIHINLVSPSSEKAAVFFQQSPTSAQPKESELPSSNAAAAAAAAERAAASTEEEAAVDVVEEIEEEKPSDVEEETRPTESVEETTEQPPNASDQSKARFTVAPAWQRTQGFPSPSTPPACSSSPTAAEAEVEGAEAAGVKDPVDPVGELVLSPSKLRNAAEPQSDTAASHCSADVADEVHPPASGSSVKAEGNPDNPFGVRLRKTSALRHFSSEEEKPEETPTEEPPQPVGVRPLASQPVSSKPAVPKKPDVHRDNGGKIKSTSDPAAGCGASGRLDSPSWISVAKQKQKIYKDSSMEEIPPKKEEPERKSSLPTYVTSAANREQGNKTTESAATVSLLDVTKPSAPAGKEARRSLSASTLVPLQTSKSSSLPSPIAPKPQFLPASVKPTPQATSAPRSLSLPTPVPVYQKSPSCTSPPSLSKAAPSLPTAQPQSATVTSPPATSRAALESTASRAPGNPGHAPSAQRGPPAPALPQEEEPPWMALAKKKAKAWSEMPQIVQ